MMHFPLFRICPLFPKLFRTPRKISTFLTIFYLVIHHKFTISPYFPLSIRFPLLFLKQSLSPTSANSSPDFVIFTCLLHALRVFRFPPTFTMMHLCITKCTYWTPL